MHRGYFKHYRKMRDWPWRDMPLVFSVWCFLLEEAAGVERDKRFRGERITLKPGQLVCGRKQISLATGVSEGYVQKILKRLEKEQQITQDTSSKNRLISIVKWGDYQANNGSSNDRVTAKEQQSNNRVTHPKKVEKEELKNKAQIEQLQILLDQMLSQLETSYFNPYQFIKSREISQWPRECHIDILQRLLDSESFMAMEVEKPHGYALSIFRVEAQNIVADMSEAEAGRYKDEVY